MENGTILFNKNSTTIEFSSQDLVLNPKDIKSVGALEKENNNKFHQYANLIKMNAFTRIAKMKCS